MLQAVSEQLTINLLHTAPNLMPEDANLEIFDIDGIPAFNRDAENNMPEKTLNQK